MANATATPMTVTQKVIAIAVTILIITTVAIPIIDDVQDHQYTEYQNPGAKYTAVASNLTSALTLSLLKDDAGVSINGQVIESDISLGRATAVVISDAFMITVQTAGFYVYYVDQTELKTSTSTLTIDLATDNSYTITLSDSSEITGTFTECYYANNDGKFGVFQAYNDAGKIFINKGQEIYAFYGGYASSSGNIGVWFKGNSADGYTLKHAFIANADSVESATLTANITDQNKFSNQEYFTSEISYTLSDEAVVAKWNMSVLAPIAYYAESSEDQSLSSLIGVIPILLILVPVMLAVRMITLRRN